MTEDVLDGVEFEAARSGDHAWAAQRMVELSEKVRAQSDVSRAEALTRAGEQWEIAGEPERAVELFRLAIADGGSTWLDARAYLTGALFRLGRESEARELVEQLWRDRPADPKVHQWVAEALVDVGDLADAQRWATAGVECCLHGERSGDNALDLQTLLRIRYRARVDLGLPEDDLDRMLETAGQHSTQQG